MKEEAPTKRLDSLRHSLKELIDAFGSQGATQRATTLLRIRMMQAEVGQYLRNRGDTSSKLSWVDSWSPGRPMQ